MTKTKVIHTNYVEYNPNPLGNKTSDCVVRAMVKATGLSWNDVYKELCEIGFELKTMPNNDESWKQFLINKGFTYNKLSIKKGMKRPTVASFCKDNKSGTHVLRVANHIVTAVDGKSFDSWDSSECSMYGYWSK